MTTALTAIVRVLNRRAAVHTASLVRSRDVLSSSPFQVQLTGRRRNDMADIKEIVNAKIAGKKVMMFSKSYCPFCSKAKQAFQQLIADGVLSPDDYEVMEIENHPNCDEIQIYLGTLTGARSVSTMFMSYVSSLRM